MVVLIEQFNPNIAMQPDSRQFFLQLFVAS
jgi:hypothetical protein